MTLNNLAEQLPWLLRNPRLARPAGLPSSAASDSSASSSLSNSALAACSPTNLNASSRIDHALPNGSGSSSVTVTITPRSLNTTGLLTPALTGSTSFSSLQQSSLANSDAGDQPLPDIARKASANGPLGRLRPEPSIPSVSGSSTTPLTPSRGLQKPATMPSVSRLAPLATALGLSTPPRGTSNALGSGSARPNNSSSQRQRSKIRAAPSPSALEFGSELDPDELDMIVDLTTADIAANRKQASPCQKDDPHRRNTQSSGRGKKRKSMDVYDSPEKSTPAAKWKATNERKGRQTQATEDSEDDPDDFDCVGDFPDVDELVGLFSFSPARPRQTPANPSASKPNTTPTWASEQSPTQSPEQSPTVASKPATPRKKQARKSARDGVVMDSEDEFVTPPTRNVSFAAHPHDAIVQDNVDDSDGDDDRPVYSHSPFFHTSQRVADTPKNNSPRNRISNTSAHSESSIQQDENSTSDKSTVYCGKTANDDISKHVPFASKVGNSSPTATKVSVSGVPSEPESAPAAGFADEHSGKAGEDEDMERFEKRGVDAYWPALRFMQHDIEEKLRQNTIDYTKALREKSSALRLKIKGDKEPLLNKKHAVDKLVDEFRSYANLFNDQETLLHTITEAYQNHQDTEEDEARLDKLTAELQEREESLLEKLSAASVSLTNYPPDFEAGSPHDLVVVPATQHPENAAPPKISKSTIVVEGTTQVVLQTQMAPPPRPHPSESHATDSPRQSHAPVSRQQQSYSRNAYADDSNNMPDYFDDDDFFAAEENLPPMSASRYAPGSARQQQSNYSPHCPSAASKGPDLFSDFSDDVEMMQVAESFEIQHTSSAEVAPARPPLPRQVLSSTSGNAMVPFKETTSGPSRKLATTAACPSQKGAFPPELMRFGWSQDVRRALKDRFRMSGFRHNQLEAINATLAGNDAFVLMPTGGGKSLCYQLPAVISSGKTSGVTVVISPLLSLMQDQVDHLRALNIAASSFSGSTPAAARKLIIDLFYKRQPEHYLQLLYVTPEMVNKSQQFVTGLATLYKNKRLARIVIDEAHCVSQWGHDFRPDYKALGKIRRQFPDVPVMALTATATPNVIVDIKHHLSIDGCKVFSQSFNRPNLYYEVRVKGAGCLDSIGNMIKSEYSGQTGIVYTLSQKSTESIAKKLSTKFGISAHHYHAGLEPTVKAQIQRDWQQGRIKVVVATIAFGMGIDKPDVRFVVHYYLPKSLEGYYQETGRAGRDNQPSNCFLYFGYGDIKNLRKFISDSDGSEAQKERQREMLHRMIDFCENQRDCRRTEILRYFGETFDPGHCGKTCDNCKSESTYDLTDFTEYAVAALQIVNAYELITMVQCCDILQANRRIKQDDVRFEQLQTVNGIAKQIKKQDLHKMIYRLLGESALEEENIVVRKSDMAVQYLKIGRCARDFFSGRKKLQIVIKVNESATAVPAPKKTKATKKTADGTAKPAKKTKATSKTKATAGSATASGASKKRKAPAAILDEAEAAADDDVDENSDSDHFDGARHSNGYARDNFVVSDNDDTNFEENVDDDESGREAERPRRQAVRTKATPLQLQQYAYQETSQSRSRTSQTPQRQRRLEELGAPIARDSRLLEANIDPVHADVIANFVDEARRLEERIRNEKGMRVLFTETHLREMAIGWTDTLDAMQRIHGIDKNHVKQYGPKFVPVIKRYKSIYQEMMGGSGGDKDNGSDGGYDSPLLGPITAARRLQGDSSSSAKRPSKADLDAVVDLISSDDDDEDDDTVNVNAANYGGSRGGVIQPSSRDTDEWRAQLETLQSQTTKSSGGGGGGPRKFAKRGGFRGNFRRAGSRSSSGVTKRKVSTASTGAAFPSRSSGGGGSSRAGGGGSGIGIMPL